MSRIVKERRIPNDPHNPSPLVYKAFGPWRSVAALVLAIGLSWVTFTLIDRNNNPMVKTEPKPVVKDVSPYLMRPECRTIHVGGCPYLWCVSHSGLSGVVFGSGLTAIPTNTFCIPTNNTVTD